MFTRYVNTVDVSSANYQNVSYNIPKKISAFDEISACVYSVAKSNKVLFWIITANIPMRKYVS